MRVTFDRFAFDSERRELLERGQSLHLGPKAYRLLEILIESAPRALSKKDLHEAIWPETFVEEGNLAGLVNDLRAALGDRPRKARFIRTVHGFGYAFCCTLTVDAPPPRAGIIVFRGQDLPLCDGINILGRDASADVQIDDPTVSRNHAAITLHGDTATIEDLASKNGTFIDGAQLTGSAPLVEGQAVVLGDARLVFRRTLSSASTVSVLQRGTSIPREDEG
jgi:DNA-binding winged helix-turn-helix (wHTH) protein